MAPTLVAFAPITSPWLELLDHFAHPPTFGFPDTAMDVQAAIKVSLIVVSAEVKLHEPFAEMRGWFTPLPKTSGISDVCVAPIKGRAAGGGDACHGQ